MLLKQKWPLNLEAQQHQQHHLSSSCTGPEFHTSPSQPDVLLPLASWALRLPLSKWENFALPCCLYNWSHLCCIFAVPHSEWSPRNRCGTDGPQSRVFCGPGWFQGPTFAHGNIYIDLISYYLYCSWWNLQGWVLPQLVSFLKTTLPLIYIHAIDWTAKLLF